jgi:methionyl-tRNA formyltransferase
MKSRRVLYMGTPSFAVPTLQHLIALGLEIVGVVTQPDRPSGRGKKHRPSPVKLLAQTHQLPIFQPESLKDVTQWAPIAATSPDICVVVAYGQILREEHLALPPLGCLNLHASILPRWRGAAPIHSSILSGDGRTGVSVMQMERGLDTGPVLSHWETPIGPTETSGDLHDRLSREGARLMGEVIEKMDGNNPHEPQPQDDKLATYAPMLKKSDGIVDFSRPAAEFTAHINAMNPWPGVTCQTGSGALRLCRAQVLETKPHQLAPGTVLDTDEKGILLAVGQDTTVRILECQRPGKRLLKAIEYLRGSNIPIVGQVWHAD